MPFPEPDFRVTCSDSGLVFIPWHPWLIGRHSPSDGAFMRGAPSFVLADLTILRDGPDGLEAVVKELTKPKDICFRQTLIGWASSLGYRRVWWRDEVVDLNVASGAFGGVARARCRICGADWFDDSPEFWLVSSERGVFPLWCPLCGGFLPQWSVEPRPGDGAPMQAIGERL